MVYYLEIYFLVFIIYSVLGWLMECALSLIQKRKLVNRGFLIGPYCPIYGIGVVGVTLILSNFSKQMTGFLGLVAVFFVSVVLCGILEYFTSYIMEKLFNARWWDYSDKKFNINGRVCPETLIPFGFLSVAILKVTNPIIFDFLHNLPKNNIMYASITIAILFVIDIAISYKIISGFKNINKAEKDNTEEISKKVRETAEATITKLIEQKNLLYRKVKINKYSILKNIKFTRKKHTRKIKNQQFTLVGDLKRRIQNIDIKIKGITKETTDKINNIKDMQLNKYKDIKEKFIGKSKLNKRLISAFPNVKQREYTRKGKKDNK